jgi:hypothetical protein
LAVDPADRRMPEAIVIDWAGYGVCAGVALDVKNSERRTIHARHVRPIWMLPRRMKPPVTTAHEQRCGSW